MSSPWDGLGNWLAEPTRNDACRGCSRGATESPPRLWPKKPRLASSLSTLMFRQSLRVGLPAREGVPRYLISWNESHFAFSWLRRPEDPALLPLFRRIS